MEIITLDLRQPKRIVIASVILVVLLMTAAIWSGIDFVFGGLDQPPMLPPLI